MTGAGAEQWPSHGVLNSVLLSKPFAPAQVVTAVSQLLNQVRPPIDLDRSRLPSDGLVRRMSDNPPTAKPEVKPRESDEARRRIIEEYAADLRKLSGSCART